MELLGYNFKIKTNMENTESNKPVAITDTVSVQDYEKLISVMHPKGCIMCSSKNLKLSGRMGGYTCNDCGHVFVD